MTNPKFDRDVERIIDHHLIHAIFKIAWPTIASLFVVNLFNLVDLYWVGKLGTIALSGMTASAFLVWSIHSIGLLVGTGVNAIVARKIGQYDANEAGFAGSHGIILSLALGIVFAIVGLMFQRFLFASLRLEQTTQQAAIAYLTPLLYGLPLITLWYAVEGIFRGAGDTFTPMWVNALSLTLNMVLDPLLIFGIGPFPQLGIAGAAWATIFAHGLASLGCLFLLWMRSYRPRIHQGNAIRIDRLMITHIIRIGAPIAISAFLFAWTYVLLTRVISSFGSSAIAALGVGHRIEGIGYYICAGFSAASSVLVGQNLGAKRKKAAAKAAWKTTYIAAITLGTIAAITYIFAEPFVAFFANDPEVIAHGKDYLRIITLLEFAMAFEVVLEGGFSGAGNSMPPMLITVPLTLIRFPISYILVFWMDYSIIAVWWTINITTLLKGAAMIIWFKKNRWMSALEI